VGPAEVAARVQDGSCQQLSIIIGKVRLPNASDDSPSGNPSVSCVLIPIRRWENLEDPPERPFPQLVGDWLYGILGVYGRYISVFARGIASSLRWGILSNASGDIPP
jgi:hypothetical protein